MNKYCIITTTCHTLENAEEITSRLINSNLVCSIQSHPVLSIYKWDEDGDGFNEIVLTIYTKTSLYKDVEKCILDNHSSKTPQIIQIPIINGYAGYLEHIDEETI